jgi:hypothetical protein
VDASDQSKFTCRDWSNLPKEQKQPIIQAFIDQAKSDNVVLKLSAEYYVRELDALIKTYAETKNDGALNASLGITIHTIAAMEGDWNNGENKLEHAKKFMGADNFEAFRKRYPEKYKRLLKEK